MDYCPEPFFLNVNGRQLFCTRPKSIDAEAHKPVLILPPFAEEMNRVRRYVTHISHVLLAQGFTVLSLDLSSTGDSSGKFSEARVAHWLEELGAAAKHISSSSVQLNVLGFRGGALFLPEILKDGELNVGKVCLVEPISTGSQLLNEFLRVRVAKSVFEGTKETVSSLATVLEGGHSLEVAGYELSPTLYHELLDLSLESQEFSLSSPGSVVGCMRVVNDARLKKLEHAVGAWQCPANSFATRALQIEPFWANDLAIADAELDNTILDYFSNGESGS